MKHSGEYTSRTIDPSDPRFNHCLKKEIKQMTNPAGFIPSDEEKRFAGLLMNGKASIGTPVELFIKLVESKDFRDYSIHTFVTKDGSIVTMYGTVKKSPVKIDELEVGDCVEVTGKIAQYGQFGGNNQTRISHVKINTNKGSKK